MFANQIFELSMSLDNEQFQEMLARMFDKADTWHETENGYVDCSLSDDGITVFYRDSKYKKKVRLSVNTNLWLSLLISQRKVQNMGHRK